MFEKKKEAERVFKKKEVMLLGLTALPQLNRSCALYMTPS